MTYYVSSGTLNRTHSLTHCILKMKFLGRVIQKLEPEQDRQTHTDQCDQVDYHIAFLAVRTSTHDIARYTSKYLRA